MTSRHPTLLSAFSSTGPGRALAQGLVKRFNAHLVGAENVPRRGPALLVSNHGLWGSDSVALTALLVLDVGRPPRFLGEKNLWKVPGLRYLLEANGAIPGVPDDAVRLLEQGELVLVYPGGVDDSFKLRSEAYELKWGSRAGFARVALRAGAPIVPIAATGIDEMFEVKRRETVIGRRLFGSPRYDLPIVSGVAVGEVPLVYHALAPVAPAGDANDAGAVEQLRSAVLEAIESVLRPERERIRRSSAAQQRGP